MFGRLSAIFSKPSPKSYLYIPFKKEELSQQDWVIDIYNQDKPSLPI